MRKHASKSPHACSFNKAAKLLLFYWLHFCALSLLLWGKCFIVPPRANTSSQKGKEEETGGRGGTELSLSLSFFGINRCYSWPRLDMKIKTCSLQNNTATAEPWSSHTHIYMFPFSSAPCHVQMILCSNLISFVLRLGGTQANGPRLVSADSSFLAVVSALVGFFATSAHEK